MSVVKSIELVIPKEIYVAGSTVEGQLILSLHSTLVDPLVKVELIGRGYLEWTEEANMQKDYIQPANCVNKADYVHKTKTFRTERNWLDLGVHGLDFDFFIPPRIPSTFTSRVGWISYFLQALCATRELIVGKQKYILVQGTSIYNQDNVESKDTLERTLAPSMSVVKSIELVIPKEIYVAGSTVEGQLILSLHSTLVDPLVKVELIGRGYLEWTEEANMQKDYIQPASCVNKADYVHKTKTFKIERNWLGPGVHVFDFDFILPPRIPSTFTSRVGRISYFLQALCATRELILGKQKKYILVQGTSIFSQDSIESKYPLTVEVQKVLLYNCCIRNAPITLRMSLGKSIYAPGDNINFTTEITNPTGKSIRKVVFTLHSVVLYKAFNFRAEHRTLEQHEEMMRLESSIERGPCEVTLIHSTFSLPSVMPVTSSYKSDDIMEIGYELTGIVYFPWCLHTVVAKIPIIIRNEATNPQE